MNKETEDAFKTLGSLVTEGFTIINNQLDKVESRLDKVDGRLDKVDGRLDKIESDLHYIRNDTKTIPDLFKLIKEQDEDISILKAHTRQ